MSILKASVILGLIVTFTAAGVCTMHAISVGLLTNNGVSTTEWFLVTPVSTIDDGSECLGAGGAMDAKTEFNMAEDGLTGSPIDFGLAEIDDDDDPILVPTSTGVIDREGPNRVLIPLADAAAEDIVFIAGTGTTEAETDLRAIETEMGTFDGFMLWLRPAIEEFCINSTVVDELL